VDDDVPETTSTIFCVTLFTSVPVADTLYVPSVSFSICSFLSARRFAAFSSKFFLSSRFFSNLSFCLFSVFSMDALSFEPLVLV